MYTSSLLTKEGGYMKLFRKKYRIIKEDRVTGILPYRIQERYTILFFLHWWGTPVFAPPHLFDTQQEAYDYIKSQDADGIIYDLRP